MSLRLGCDCTYTMKTRVLWQSIRESGVYWIDDGRLLFTRASGEVTAWPYALVGERLTLTEAAGETHDYQRKASLRCP